MTLLIAFWIWSMPQVAAQPPAPSADLLQQIACAPVGQPAPTAAPVRILGGTVHGRIMFGPGDPVILGAGAAQGMRPGQQYFVRRLVMDPATTQPKVGALYGVHTAGWVTVVDVKDSMAIASVTRSCDGIFEGDYLEPFVPPTLPPTSLSGAPDYQNPGHIMLADEGRQMASPGAVVLVDRGTENGVRGGQFLTIYRETLSGLGPILDVGRGTVLSASANSSLVRIDSSNDAVFLGDLVAIHRITP